MDPIERQAAIQPEQQHGRVFKGVVVEYPPYNIWKPYFSIKYTENGQEFIGYGTYKPEVLSEYLKEYFMPSAQPEQRWIPKEVEMKIPVKLDKGAYMPEKAHETDAGYDIRTPHSFLLRRSDMVMVHTGIHVNIPVGFYGELASKSGLCRDSEITTEAGIIDSGYTGEICVILKSGMKQRYFEAGDKITQLIIHELPYTELEAVDILPHTDRGADGFGSTGK